MTKQLIKSRNRAFKKQSGKCYYCGCRMWQKNHEKFARDNSITHIEALKFQCTAEHLLARSKGGSSSKHNIVAACKFCNQARHGRNVPPDPITYKLLIQRQLSRGKWHPKSQHHLIANLR